MKKWTQLFFSNIGKRNENQDFISFISSKRNKRIIDILIVCDGVGGRPDGKECSETIGREVQKKVLTYLRNRKSKSSIDKNDLYILKSILSRLPKLNASSLSRTTLALVLFDRKASKHGNSCIALWAGDSRIYAIEPGSQIFQISSDQYKDDEISVVFSGDGKLIGEMGSSYLTFKNPLLICVTSDGMNCKLNGLYKFFIACAYFQINSNEIFEERVSLFLNNLISDNYSAALLYKRHSVNILKKLFDKELP